MQDIAIAVADDLNLNVPRPLDIAFEIQRAVAKCFLGLMRRVVESRLEFGRRVGDHHSSAAAAGGGLGDDRIADPLGDLQRVGDSIDLLAARDHRDTGRLGQRPRGKLVTYQPDRFRPRADEGEACLFALLVKGGPLRQKAVARMHRIALRHERRVDE